MDKNKYIKWRGRYENKAEPTDFCLDMKELENKKVKLIHKQQIFANLTREEYNIFDSWTKKEQLQFLEDYWNYYMVLQN